MVVQGKDGMPKPVGEPRKEKICQHTDGRLKVESAEKISNQIAHGATEGSPGSEKKSRCHRVKSRYPEVGVGGEKLPIFERHIRQGEYCRADEKTKQWGIEF